MNEFFKNGRIVKGLNLSFIALIPKVDCLDSFSGFRLINLLGSVYKILAKTLATHLKCVIHEVISKFQSAFIKDRQIVDRILISNEIINWWVKKFEGYRN